MSVDLLIRPAAMSRTGRAAPVSRPFWPPAARAIAALDPGGCRWPMGEVGAEDFAFCNAPRQRGSYCAAHHGLSRRKGGRA